MQLRLQPILLVLTVLLYQIISAQALFSQSLFVSEYFVFRYPILIKNTGDFPYNNTQTGYCNETLLHDNITSQLIDNGEVTIKNISDSQLDVSEHNFSRNLITISTRPRCNLIKIYNALYVPEIDLLGIQNTVISISLHDNTSKLKPINKLFNKPS
ncbi:hypothetical protein [Aquimarina sp. LLG6339-5]|uniref:hypothetical protein n=1 Tax=Aquimarina sp. LLG6339-5 TaxID=3160830 RepID=UPI00386549CD